jgi:hypothetical protein
MTELQSNKSPQGARTMVLFFAWVAVTVPLLWGVAQTLRKALALFR